MSRSPDQLSCEQVQQSVEALVDNDLAPAMASRIRTHLTECADCAAQARLAHEISTELRALPELDAPVLVVQKIFAQTTRSGISRRWWLDLLGGIPRPTWAAMAAAALILVIGLGFLGRHSPISGEPDAATIAQATAEARLALAHTGLLTRKAGLVVRDRALRDQIMAPTQRGLTKSLKAVSDTTSGTSLEGADDV